MKNLTVTNKLKRCESYYQPKYSNNKYSKDYAKSYSRQFFSGREKGSLPKKVLKDQSRKLQGIFIPASEVNSKHTSQNFHRRQIAEHI